MQTYIYYHQLLSNVVVEMPFCMCIGSGQLNPVINHLLLPSSLTQRHPHVCFKTSLDMLT